MSVSTVGKKIAAGSNDTYLNNHIVCTRKGLLRRQRHMPIQTRSRQTKKQGFEMAHYQQLRFVEIVRDIFPEFFQHSKVLEVGSWDVATQIRRYFTNCDYLGIDIAAGPGVDLVCQGQACECFEHNKYWLETFTNMLRTLRPHGLVVLSCAAKERIEYGTSRRSSNLSLTSQTGLPDYYHNLSRKEFSKHIYFKNHFACWGFAEGRYSRDLYFIGIKKGANCDDDVVTRLQRVLEEAKTISVAPTQGVSERRRRRMITIIRKNLENILGARVYHNLTYQVDKLLGRGF
jgi:hypothetical protein